MSIYYINPQQKRELVSPANMWLYNINTILCESKSEDIHVKLKILRHEKEEIEQEVSNHCVIC